VPVVPKPAYLTQVQEPTYHGLLTRIAGDADSPYGPCSENSCNWTQVVRQNYSKIQPWNSNSVLLAIDNNDAGPGYGPSRLLSDGSHYGVVQNSN